MIVCAPANTLGKHILQVLDKLDLARDHSTLSVLMDVSSLPSWITSINTWNKERQQQQQNITKITHNVNNYDTNNFLSRLSFISKTYLLIYAESDFNISIELRLENKIRKSLDILNNNNNYQYDNIEEFTLLDMRDDNSLRSLVTVHMNVSDYYVEEYTSNLEEWNSKHKDNECENCEHEFAKLLSVFIILGCSSLFVAVLLGIAAIARYHLLKKRITKGPYKVLLTATDFVFPQIADSRRVSNLSDVLSFKVQRTIYINLNDLLM